MVSSVFLKNVFFFFLSLEYSLDPQYAYTCSLFVEKHAAMQILYDFVASMVKKNPFKSLD